MRLFIKLLSGCVLCSSVSVFAEEDTRSLVNMPPMMQQHMLNNMRSHLNTLNRIQQALADKAFDTAAELAEQNLGISSLNSHGASHMAAYLPAPMQAMGTQMHRAASQFALIAQESAIGDDLHTPLAALSQITQQCVACHNSYRIR